MLETVDVGTQDANLYERSTGAETVAQLRELAAPLEAVIAWIALEAWSS
jgi:hypothetical protein